MNSRTLLLPAALLGMVLISPAAALAYQADGPDIQFDQDFDFGGDADFGDDFNFNIENDEPSPAELAVAIACYGVVILISLGIWIWVLITLSSSLAALPESSRLMQPGEVWLLLIPLFNVIWIFFVFIRIPKSYQAHFRSVGRHDYGDCGEQLGLMYCICVLCSMIPCIGVIPAVASLVMLILFVVKVSTMKRDVLQNPGGATKPW